MTRPRPRAQPRPVILSIHETLVHAFPTLPWSLHTADNGYPIRSVYQPSNRFWIRVQPDTSTRHIRVECRIRTEVYDGAESWPCRDDREMVEAVKTFLKKYEQCFRFEENIFVDNEEKGVEYA